MLQRKGRPHHTAGANTFHREQFALERSKRFLILSLGNSLRGDDGVGDAVIAALAERMDLPTWVDLIAAGLAGMKILTLLEGYEQAIIIDAADSALVQGRWARLDLDELITRSKYSAVPHTLHEADLVDALVIGQAMEILPGHLVVYAIGALKTDGGRALSSPVAHMIPEICQAILEEIEAAGS
jgi:hydrogenase maturation protease